MTFAESMQVRYFDKIFESWKNSIVSIKLRFVAIRVNESWRILSAKIQLSPFECVQIKHDVFGTSDLLVGEVSNPISSYEIDKLMERARAGCIRIKDASLMLFAGQDISLYVPVMLSEPDSFIPLLEIRGNSQVNLASELNYAQINAELRCGKVPFDGLVDLLSFFGFGSNGHLPNEGKISIEISPPADLIIDRCSLDQNRLKLHLLRRTSFAVEQVSIGLRQFPNPTIFRRMQIADQVRWTQADGGFERGDLEMALEDCTTAELMISVDGFSVRRCFLFDSHKSLNPRLTDYRYLDANLTQLRKYLISPKDARQLEVGTAALLHLLGANSLNPPGTDSPDVIVETPQKRLALVECTTRVDNVREKTAKLVGRRDGLVTNENKYGINREVMAILLVNQPLTSLVNERAFLIEHQVLLLTLEDINSALNNLEIPFELDQLYVEKSEEMRELQKRLLGGLS